MRSFFRRFVRSRSCLRKHIRTNPRSAKRPGVGTVHRAFPRGTVVLVTAVFLFPLLEADAAEPGDIGRLQRQQAEGWLQLKRDQKTFREAIEPLTPREAERLNKLERRQRMDARTLQRRQRQSLATERNLRRRAGIERPVSIPRELENRRQLDRQRLRMRIQRKVLSPGLR